MGAPFFCRMVPQFFWTEPPIVRTGTQWKNDALP